MLVARSAVSVLDGKPIRELLTLSETGISIVVNVSDFVNQYIVQVEIPDRTLRPD